MYLGLHVKYLYILPDFSEIGILSTDFQIKLQYQRYRFPDHALKSVIFLRNGTTDAHVLIFSITCQSKYMIENIFKCAFVGSKCI